MKDFLDNVMKQTTGRKQRVKGTAEQNHLRVQYEKILGDDPVPTRRQIQSWLDNQEVYQSFLLITHKVFDVLDAVRKVVTIAVLLSCFGQTPRFVVVVSSRNVLLNKSFVLQFPRVIRVMCPT